MSEGATRSAPARAWLTAVRASSSTVASLSTRAVVAEHAAVAVVGVLAEADVGDHQQLGTRLLDRARTASCTTPSSSQAPEPSASFAAGIPNSITPAIPSAAARGPPRATRRDRQALDAGHRRDRLAPRQRRGLRDEQRQHELAGAQLGLAHEPAQRALARSRRMRVWGKAIALQDSALARRHRTRRRPARASAPNSDRERGEVDERDPQRGRGRLTAASSACRAALNGNTNETARDRVVEPAADRPGGHEREEDERQREQEREQRGGAHLAGERADRDAERAEGERAEREREQPQPDARPVERARRRRSRRASRRRPRTRSRRRAAPSRRAAPRARGTRPRRSCEQAPERVLFALERDPPAASSRHDEHHRDADGDHDRERVERRAAAVQQRAVDARSAGRRREHRLRSAEVLAAKVAKAAIRSSAARSGPAAGGRSRGAARRDLTEPDQVCGRAEHAELPP